MAQGAGCSPARCVNTCMHCCARPYKRVQQSPQPTGPGLLQPLLLSPAALARSSPFPMAIPFPFPAPFTQHLHPCCQLDPCCALCAAAHAHAARQQAMRPWGGPQWWACGWCAAARTACTAAAAAARAGATWTSHVLACVACMALGDDAELGWGVVGARAKGHPCLHIPTPLQLLPLGPSLLPACAFFPLGECMDDHTGGLGRI